MRINLIASVSLLLVDVACFSEAPGSSESAEVTSSAQGSDTTTTDVTTQAEASASTSSSSTSSASTADASSSTGDGSSTGVDSGSESSGGPELCACFGGAAFCETFEAPFDPDVDPWNVPLAGTAPTATSNPVACGRGALSTAVAFGDVFAVTAAQLPESVTEPGMHRIETWLQLQGECSSASTRVLRLLLGGPDLAFLYAFDVYADATTVELRMINPQGGIELYPVAFELQSGVGYAVAMEFDYSVQPPAASLSIDGALLLDAVDGPNVPLVPAGSTVEAVLGVYRDGAQFSSACAAYFDDFAAG